MKRIALAALIAAFAMGPALAQESCESKAISKEGKPLAGAAKTSFVKKCKRDACTPKAIGSDGKALKGAAKNSFMAKCAKDAQCHGVVVPRACFLEGDVNSNPETPSAPFKMYFHSHLDLPLPRNAAEAAKLAASLPSLQSGNVLEAQ